MDEQLADMLSYLGIDPAAIGTGPKQELRKSQPDAQKSNGYQAKRKTKAKQKAKRKRAKQQRRK